MRTLSEEHTIQFYAWERLGRGWLVGDEPCDLEPPFIPFYGHFLPPQSIDPDLGRIQTPWGMLFKKISSLFSPTQPDVSNDHIDYTDLDIEPIPIKVPRNIIELIVRLPKEYTVNEGISRQLLNLLSTSNHQISFEIVGTAESVVIQFGCEAPDATRIADLLEAYIPGVRIQSSQMQLDSQWLESGAYYSVEEFALADEFTRPINDAGSFNPDSLIAAVASLESLVGKEAALIQVLFKGVVNPWASSIVAACGDGAGGSFFADDHGMLTLAQEKVSAPLFGVVIRVAAKSYAEDRSPLILDTICRNLIQTSSKASNRLVVPFQDFPDYSITERLEDVVDRVSRRVGMILNANELLTFVHLPTTSVASAKLRSTFNTTYPVKAEFVGSEYEIGVNEHLGESRTVSIPLQHRLRHIHIVGATGVGKSTLISHLIAQDVRAGNGLTLLDPHGDLVDEVVAHLPHDQLDRVVYIDPSDLDFPVGFNLLEAQSEQEKIILSSDLVALFKKHATSWGDQMTSVLANAIDALVENKQRWTLLDLKRFLVDTKERELILSTCTEETTKYYWAKEFPLLKTQSIAPLITRLDSFLRPKPIRYMMVQPQGIDFHMLIDSNSIILIKLSQGLLGEENAHLLGSLMVSKIHQAILARANVDSKERQSHFLYIDEFQHFTTPSMNSILTGARKYKLGLILAHQNLHQLSKADSDIGNTVLANAGSRICFRLGEEDAIKMARGFEHFESSDLGKLSIGQAIGRIGGAEDDFNLVTSPPSKVDKGNVSKEIALRNQTNERFGLSRGEVEELVRRRFAAGTKDTPDLPEKSPERTKLTTKEKEEVQAIENKIDLEESAASYIEQEDKKQEEREHRYLQQLIAKLGQDHGFKSDIEYPTKDGKGKVDVSLQKDNFRIAFEVSVTTSVKHEIKNITKCIKDGFDLIVAVSNSKTHLENIKNATRETQAIKTRVLFLQSKEITEVLQTVSSKLNPPKLQKDVVKGYRVKLRYSEGPDSGSGEIERIISETMRRKDSYRD
jgi:hypothetical protein